MIDFIVLSRDPKNTETLSQSIALTLGNLSPWNLTIVDGNQYDLFSGFNLGARQTEGDILVFVHDDVQFLGSPLTMAGPLNLLKDPKVGFIGVAGSRMLEPRTCQWWGGNTDPEIVSNCRGMVYHAVPAVDFGLVVDGWPHQYAIQFGQVLVLDGVLLMCSRRTFGQVGGFDDKNYKGFHFYDIDITFGASLANLVNLAAPIPILHGSIGGTDANWETNRAIFLKKYGHLLPASIKVGS
jgi:hypothetical protein